MAFVKKPNLTLYSLCKININIDRELSDSCIYDKPFAKKAFSLGLENLFSTTISDSSGCSKKTFGKILV